MDKASKKNGIIILNYNHANDTISLVNSIIEELTADYCFIIVDNNSDDAHILVEFVKKKNYSVLFTPDIENYRLRNQVTLILSNKNEGYAKGNNIGLKLLLNNGINYAFILNPDVGITNISVFNCLATFLREHPNVGIASPKVINPDGSIERLFTRINLKLIFINFLFPFSEIFLRSYRLVERKLRGYNTIYGSIGCFYALNLAIMQEIDFFDEKMFLYGEEHIIAEKLLTANYIFAYVPKVSIKHNHNYKEKPINKTHSAASYDYYLSTYMNLNAKSKAIIELSLLYRCSINKTIKAMSILSNARMKFHSPTQFKLK